MLKGLSLSAFLFLLFVDFCMSLSSTCHWEGTFYHLRLISYAISNSLASESSSRLFGQNAVLKGEDLYNTPNFVEGREQVFPFSGRVE